MDHHDEDDQGGEYDDSFDLGELRSVEYSYKDGVIFLVDCHAPMINQHNDKHESLLQFTLRAIASSYRAKIIESPDDLLGICFYGSRNARNSNGFDGIYVWSEMQEPSPNVIMALEKAAASNSSCRQFVEEELGGGMDGEAEFAKALWSCSTMFSEGLSQKKNLMKRIFYFTCNDFPNRLNQSFQQLAIQKIKDLRDLNIMFDLFPVISPFSTEKFFNRIVTIPSEEFTGNFDVESSAAFEDLTRKIRRKRHNKRALLSCHLTIGKVKFGVKAYCLINKTRKGTPVWLDARTNQPLSIESKYICENSGQALEDYEMKKTYPYGDVNVAFNEEEIKMIKTIPIGNLDNPETAVPGITLVGFKPRSSLRIWHNIKQSYFIHPDEGSIEGSETFARALIEEMCNMDKIAIAWLVTRSKASIPKLIALLPQKEKIDSEGYTVEPGGFHAIFLPYADDIRDSEQKDNGPEPDPELLRRAHKLIELGTTPSYETLSNPSLQHHYAVLQALALNLPDVEKVEDTVEPDQRFVEQFENVHEEFARLVYGEDADLDDPEGLKSSSGQKRKTTAQSSKDKASSSKPPSKRGGAAASKRGGRGGKK